MPDWDPYGSPGFSLDDGKVATWNATDDYATQVDIPSIRILGGDPEITEASLEGDDEITDTNMRLKSWTVEVEFGSLSLDALAVLLGIDVDTDGALYEAMKFDNVNAPYVGLCGRALQSGGDGDVHLFWPRAKVTAISGIQLAQDGYVIPRATLRAIPDATYGIFQPIKHATSRAVAIPPTYAQS